MVITNAKECLTISSGIYLAISVSAAGLITCSSEAPGQLALASFWLFPRQNEAYHKLRKASRLSQREDGVRSLRARNGPG